MIAFTFPGQGSQHPGMGRAWRQHPSWELVEEASAATGRDLVHLLCDADLEELTATQNAQLATFVLSLVALDAIERTGVEPAILAGHSLGEYTALAAAGAFSYEDGVRLVTERGEAMADAAARRPGTMAVVLGLDDDDTEIACARIPGDVWVANYNAPGQVVIAGSPDAVAEAGAEAKELGAKRLLPISVVGAFHTPFMAPARDRLTKAIAMAELHDLEVPVVANVDALPHHEADDWVPLMAAQLCTPVRWRAGLHTMADKGVATFVEIGPGKALTGMAKRTIPGAQVLSVGGPADIDTLLETLAGPETGVGPHEGEHLYTTERMIVSPAAGLFEPTDDTGPGRRISTGDLVGVVGAREVRSPFSGEIVGMLAVAGERVTASQPIAWMRTA